MENICIFTLKMSTSYIFPSWISAVIVLCLCTVVLVPHTLLTQDTSCDNLDHATVYF